MRVTRLTAAVAAAFFVPGLSICVAAREAQTFTVNCARGQTITKALELGDSRKPMLVVVRGTCNEDVAIMRDDVTLQGDPTVGGTINGSSTGNTINIVAADRVVLDRLTINGGVNGVRIAGTLSVAIANSEIRGATQSGVALNNAHASINNCTIENAGNGVSLQAATARLQNNKIRANGGHGVYLNGRSHISSNGNTISSNGSNGIMAEENSNVSSLRDTISSNGAGGVLVVKASYASLNQGTVASNGGHGVYVGFASAGISGGSTISSNQGCGVYGDSVVLNVTDSTITGNQGCGVAVYLGSSVALGRSAVNGNIGDGLAVRANSTAHIDAATIKNNTGNGIFLQMGSKLVTQTPLVSDLNGNGGWGLECMDGESSVESLALLNGTVSPGCTGF